MPMVANISTIVGSPPTLANPAIANMSASRVWSAHSATFTARLRFAVVDGVWLVVAVLLMVSSSSDPSSRLLAASYPRWICHDGFSFRRVAVIQFQHTAIVLNNYRQI